MIEKLKNDLRELLDRLGRDFNLAPLVDTENRDTLTEEDYEKLGNIKNFYTISDFELISDVIYNTKEKSFDYLGKFSVRLECESNEPNVNYDDLLLFLNNEKATRLYLDYQEYKVEPYRRIIRNAKKYDSQTFMYNGNQYFKVVLGFEIQYGFTVKGGYYKWQ